MGQQLLLLLLLLDGHDFDRHELLVGRRSERARLQIVLAAEKDTPPLRHSPSCQLCPSRRRRRAETSWKILSLARSFSLLWRL